MEVAGSSARLGRGNPGRALRVLLFTLTLFVVSIVIGLAWDRAWHLTRAFDTFFSPPHLFTYSMTIATSVITAYMAYSPAIRQAFGPGLRVPGLRIEIPGCLILLGSGFGTLALAGLLDSIWHSRFGLDETSWSTPHAMLGWGLLLVMLGFVACRIALQPSRPMSGRTVMMLGLLLLSFSITPFLGPLWGNKTPETTRTIARIPVLAAQPEAQHTFRIYLTWNLNRTNPLLAPLGALWSGAALALLRGLDRRARIWVSVVVIWSFLSLLGDRGSTRRLGLFFQLDLLDSPAAWLPLPIVPAAIVLALLLRLGLREAWAWLIAGGVFGLLIARLWVPQGRPVALALIAALALLAGASLGSRVTNVLRSPGRTGVVLLALCGIGAPLLVGAIDLYLRRVTP